MHRRKDEQVNSQRGKYPVNRFLLAALVMGGLFLAGPDFVERVHAQDTHDSGGGGHDSGSSGGGHDSGSSGGGHDSGSSGGGGGSDGGHVTGPGGRGAHSGGGGGGQGRHGLGSGLGRQARKRGINTEEMHGHVSGTHDAGEDVIRGARHGIAGSHTFGGSFLGGTRHVPEGIGGGPQSGRGEPGYAGLAGGGRGFGWWGGRGTGDGDDGDGGGGDDGTGDDGTGDDGTGDDGTGDDDIGDDDTDSGDDYYAEAPTGTGGSVITSGDYFEGMTCDRYRGSEMSTRQRYTGDNLRRLKAAGLIIAPTLTSDIPGMLGFAERTLSYYQEELDKPRPDFNATGVYLGLIAERQISENYIKRLNQVLCVTMTDVQMAQTLEVARDQKAYMGTTSIEEMPSR